MLHSQFHPLFIAKVSIMKRWTSVLSLCAALACQAVLGLSLFAEDAERKTAWTRTQDPASGATVLTMELTLHPQPEPQPALRYRLIPEAFDRRDDNAAIYYLKAMGFFEQQAVLDAVKDFQRKAREAVQQSDHPEETPAPYAWVETPPGQLPIEEVKQYLGLLAFQRPFLEEAARCNLFSVDRNIREVKEPIAYLLPEIQTMRELARTQSLRCRVAIREGKIDDAIAIIGQQYALANHLGQDEFFVSNLVGAAISSIAWTDCLHLLQHADAPNLYWALAALPKPLIPADRATSTEYNLLFLQVKTLHEVDETLRPAGYWQDLVRRMIPEIRSLSDSPQAWNVDPELEYATFVAIIAAAYPGARQYLTEACKLDPELVESFSTTQTVLLATRRYYERTRDEEFKWNLLPLRQALQSPGFVELANRLQADQRHFGWITKPTDWIIPALNSIRISIARPQQTIGMLQTVEAIRDHAAQHGRLPENLAALRFPAPLDPFTGKEIHYEFATNHAVLSASPLSGLQYRLVLRLAE